MGDSYKCGLFHVKMEVLVSAQVFADSAKWGVRPVHAVKSEACTQHDFVDDCTTLYAKQELQVNRCILGLIFTRFDAMVRFTSRGSEALLWPLSHLHAYGCHVLLKEDGFKQGANINSNIV